MGQQVEVETVASGRATGVSKRRRRERPTSFPMPHDGHVSVSDAQVGIWEEVAGDRDFHCSTLLYGELIHFLRGRGWIVHTERQRHHRTLYGRFHRGAKGRLEVKTQVMGRSIEIRFFQNVSRGHDPNHHGAEYDFGRMARMPLYLRLACRVEMAAIARWAFQQRGHQLSGADMTGNGQSTPVPSGGAELHRAVRNALAGIRAEDDPVAHFRSHWPSHLGERGPDGWPSPRTFCSWGSQCRDRDGNAVSPGDVKYVRDSDGYIRRGRVYPNMNSNWLLVSGAGVSYAHDCSLFDYQDEPLRRIHPDRKRRLEAVKERAVKSEDYEKALIVRDILRREFPDKSAAKGVKSHAA